MPSGGIAIIATVGIVWAGILTYHELRQEKLSNEDKFRQRSLESEKEISDLRNARPSITVYCETELGNLRVENSGGEGEFSAKAQMIADGCPEGESWPI